MTNHQRAMKVMADTLTVVVNSTILIGSQYEN
jgi:hypothetical protein